MVFSPRHNQTPVAQISLAKKFFSLALMGLLVGAMGLYISLTNSLATKGYTIQQLQQNLSEVELSAQKLEMEVADLQSINALEPGTLPEGYVAVERVEYLSSTPQVGVAVK